MPEVPDSLFLAFQASLAGRYSLERELGRGGMGVVYLAREVRLDRLVAIKLLPPLLAVQPAVRERFLREARTAAKLSHPNIVPIFTVEEADDFVSYVMAFVDGETLARRVASRGPLPPADATRVLREVAWALAYAHAQGVVHRDVKPENILMETGTSRAMVTDFGIARLAQASGQTQAGELLGTPDYMSPEQASAEPVDGRSDLYSLGIVGYYILSGKLPFTGASARAVLAQHLTQPAPRMASVVTGIPPALAQAIDRCLQKNAADRFASGEALAEALGAALQAPSEVPVPVRVFLDRRKTLGLFLPFSFGALMLLALVADAVRQGAGAWSLVLIASQVAVVGGALPLALTLRRLRRVLRLGYAPEDLALGIKIQLERRREEFQYTHGSAPGLRERAWPLLAGGSAGVALLSAGLMIAHATPYNFWPVSVLSGYVALVFAIVKRKWQVLRGTSGSFWARFWGGRMGRWMFRVAGIGVRRLAVTAPARPTELAIGSAADALYEALPKNVRHALGDFPDVVQRLQRHAQKIRGRMAELDQLLAQANQGPGARSAKLEQRDALVGDLRAAREVAQTRLSEAVTALETLRLDLLRLRAGAGTVETLTADLAAARELGDQAQRLVKGREEVERLLVRR